MFRPFARSLILRIYLFAVVLALGVASAPASAAIPSEFPATPRSWLGYGNALPDVTARCRFSADPSEADGCIIGVLNGRPLAGGCILDRVDWNPPEHIPPQWKGTPRGTAPTGPCQSIVEAVLSYTCPSERYTLVQVGGEFRCRILSNSADTPKMDGCPGAPYGNPCDARMGNKFQREVDYLGHGAFPIVFERTYNGRAAVAGRQTGNWHVDVSWLSNYDANIVLYASQMQAWVTRPDGRRLAFFLVNGSWTTDDDITDKLIQTANGWTYSLADGRSETYDNVGKLRTITNAAGLTQTLAYDASGRLATITDPDGRVLTLGYNLGILATLTFPNGEVLRYTNTNAKLTGVTFPDGSGKLYHYNLSYAPLRDALIGISYVNTAGVATRYSTYTYDASGRVLTSEHAGTAEKFSLTYNNTTQTTVNNAINTADVLTFAINLGQKNVIAKLNQGDGKTLRQTFDANNNLTCRQDEEGRVTTSTYNALNQKTSMTEGRSGTCAAPQDTGTTRTTTYTYLSPTVHLPTSISSPSVYGGQSKVTTVTYGDVAHPMLPTQVTRSGYTPGGAAVSRSFSMTYNASGQIASIDGPRTDVADITTFTYNNCATGGGCGQVSRVTDALGHVTTFDSYDGNGRLLQRTGPNGLTTHYQYDGQGRTTRITDTPPSGTPRITQYTYTAPGDIASSVFPDGHTLAYTYNAARQLVRITDNLGNYVTYSYDLKGNRTSEKTYDPANTLMRQLDLAYDVRNRLSQLNAGGSLTQRLHDAIGNVTRVTDPNANPATQHSYDALNRLIQTLDGANGVTSYSYNVNDNVTQVRAANNATTQYSYDDLGNLLQETSADRGTTEYAYDAAGNRVSQTDARGITVNFTYDPLNRLTAADYPSTAEDITYTHDSGCTSFGTGRLCQITDASGTTVHGYDVFGNVIQQQKTELGILYTTGYTHDAADRILSITYPDGRLVTYTRDTLGRLASAHTTVNGSAQTLVSNRTYRADGVLSTQRFGNGIDETRQSDLQGRLVYQFIGSVDTRVYSHDANGNLTQIQSLPQVGSYTYDALDRLTQDAITSSPASSVSFLYDANGNRTSDGSAYSYLTASNRLTQTDSGAITTDATGNITGDGARSFTYSNSGHLASANAGTYTYNYRRQRTRKSVGAVTTVYHYDLFGNVILETDTSGQTKRVYVYLNDTPLAQIDKSGSTETITYLHVDHLNTPRLGTDGSGTAVWNWEGEACGLTPPSGSVTVNLRFPGQYYDSESGLFYNWNRYFDPKTCRYVTSDPIGLDGGLNTYAYVENNPLRFTDPEGLQIVIPGPFIPPPPAVPGNWWNPGGKSASRPGGGADRSRSRARPGSSTASKDDAKSDTGSGQDDNCPDCTMASPYQLRSAGIADAHAFKDDFGARPNSRFDICACRDGSIVIKARGACGRSGPGIPTGYRWK